MLLLDRHVGQTLVIASPSGGLITISVVRKKNGHFTFGISAPRSLSVDRLEIFNRKREEAGKPAIDLNQIEAQNHRS